jgi:diguanylate cyclase (GGDEF)-like protein
MIDINAFKTMNETYGTAVGDQSLQFMAQILKQSFSKHQFIARYGADEFVIILEVKDSSGLIKAVNRLKENVYEFNQKKLLPFELDFCIGADYYNSRSHMTAHDFLKRINNLMFLDKKEKGNV